MDKKSPILIYGDHFFCGNDISRLKNIYSKYKWVTLSASSRCADEIRMEYGSISFDDTPKVILINELPNKSAIRDFLIDISSTKNENILVIWDSEEHIKIDSKTGDINKTWADFVGIFSQIDGNYIIDNTFDAQSGEQQYIKFVRDSFAKNSQVINEIPAKLFVEIVGCDRSLLISEIEKFSLLKCKEVTEEIIIENAFPSSSEAILYKFSNILDTCSYEQSIAMMERFLSNGINENVMAEIIAKKARWQLIVCHLWASGMLWGEINDKIMEMGKFPSAIWHNGKVSTSEKKKLASNYNNLKDYIEFLKNKMGIPKSVFKDIYFDESKNGKPSKPKAGEKIPLPFMAEQITKFISNKVVPFNKKRIQDEKQLQEAILNRALTIYISVQDGLSQIRYGNNTKQNLINMIMSITNIFA